MLLVTLQAPSAQQLQFTDADLVGTWILVSIEDQTTHDDRQVGSSRYAVTYGGAPPAPDFVVRLSK